MQTINRQTVETLKANGFYFAAGALAASLKLQCYYGCHFGMRSELQFAKAEFERGFKSASI